MACPVEVLSLGVGAKKGWLSPKPSENTENNQGAQEYLFHEDETDRPTEAIRCFSLQQLRRQHGDYDALKLDVEGAELDAIKGDYRYIKETRPVLWIECNENPQSMQILSALRSLGYTPLYLAFPAFRRGNFNEANDLIFPMAYEAALLAAPSESLDCVDWTVENEDVIIRTVVTHDDLRRALFDTPRWCRQDWVELGRPELIARLGKFFEGKSIQSFLRGYDE
jgi:Methyltransferase FkbM domain